MDNYKLTTFQNTDITTKSILSDYEVTLHEGVLDILFKYKEEIYRKLIDLRGLFLLDHIAIKIIDPDHRILIFSITPSVEYNLIVHGLWKCDKSFSISFQKDNSFYQWEKAYCSSHFNEIKQIKELKHGFSFGLNIPKKLGAFNLIYSFATRSKNKGLFEYYFNHYHDLINIGDYGYRLIHSIYIKYCSTRSNIPTIVEDKYCRKPFLKLIVNNK